MFVSVGSLSFYVSNAEQSKVFVILVFIFNCQKSRISLLVTVFLALCPYSSHSSLYHSGSVLTPTLYSLY